MPLTEIRDAEDARRWLVQGLRLQGLALSKAEPVIAILQWSYHLAADGVGLLPTGMIADFGRLVIEGEVAVIRKEPLAVPQWPATVARQYEDHVLGKLLIRPEVERAIDALRRYTPEERIRGFVFVMRRLVENLNLDTVEVSPGLLRGLMKDPPEELLKEADDSFEQTGLHPLLMPQYESVTRSFRRAADLLYAEDVQAVEQRTALAAMALYVAHRQILRLATQFETNLPQRPVTPLPGRREVPTRIYDEDQYPVGGYSSISNRGSIESLLHSQLAFMEPDGSPDLFDVKFVRDELFYYSRDENQFLRRRRAFGIHFAADMVQARVKDPALPAQRGVLAMALVLTLIRKLSDWLANDALRFEIAFAAGLEEDAEIYAVILDDLIERGVVRVNADMSDWSSLARTAQMHVLNIGVTPVPLAIESTVETRLVVNGPVPRVIDENNAMSEFGTDDPMAAWQECMLLLLRLTV